MNDWYLWAAIGVIALVTAALRFLPFLFWGGKHRPPRIIERLGRVLPYSIMGMLVVYCLKDISFSTLSDFLPLLIACAVVSGLYLWKRNTLISIVAGTLSYMALVQLVF